MNLLLMLFFPIVDELDVDFARINEDSAFVGCHLSHYLLLLLLIFLSLLFFLVVDLLFFGC